MGLGHGAAFLVATPAGKGDIKYIGRRILILLGKNIVLAMTVDAIRGIRIIFFKN